MVLYGLRAGLVGSMAKNRVNSLLQLKRDEALRGTFHAAGCT